MDVNVALLQSSIEELGNDIEQLVSDCDLRSGGATITAPTSETLTDSHGAVWSLGPNQISGLGYAILKNGVQVGLGAILTLVEGIIWTKDLVNQWFSDNGSGWSNQPSAPPASSLPETIPVTDALIADADRIVEDAELLRALFGGASLATFLSIVATSAVKERSGSGITPFTFTVTRSGNLQVVTTVDFSVTGSGPNAADAADFGGALPSGNLSFAINQSTKVITVDVSGDVNTNSDEGFTVTLSSAVNATINDGEASGTILKSEEGEPPPPPGAFSEEFAGPFQSWGNLKTMYGAVGDGVADDTAAIQLALHDLATGAASPVLYIPDGTYRVTATLTLVAIEGISIIGENPATTILKWAGSNAGALLWLDGVSYSRVNRLTLDGGGNCEVLIEQGVQLNLGGGRQFDTGNQYADLVLKDAVIGIRGGAYGYGASESTVLRCKFHNISNRGVFLKNFNALDWWGWYCEFKDIGGAAISNNPGAGNFHCYESLFDSPLAFDFELLNTGNFNFRGNYSESLRFFQAQFYYTNSSITRMSDNKVKIFDRSDQYNGTSMYQGNMGPLVMTDNQFQSPASAPNPATSGNNCPISMGAQFPPDLISIGNKFTVDNPMSAVGFEVSGNRVLERATFIGALDLAPPELPGVPPNQGRQIFEVSAGANASAIQAAINQAAALNGEQPAVHLPFGTYDLDTTITIPPCDLHLIGDGFGIHGTRLNWNGSGFALVLQGPSHVTLREFTLKTYGPGSGVLIEGADQVGARVYMQQPEFAASTVSNLLVDGCNNTLVELHDAALSYTNGTALEVVGGSAPNAGRTVVISGSGAANAVTSKVSNGGNLTIRDLWYEGNNQTTFAHVSGNSTFMVDGARLSVPLNNGPLIQYAGFSGASTIFGSSPSSHVNIDAVSTGKVWIVGCNYYQAPSWLTTNAGSATAIFTLNRRDGSNGSEAIADVGTPDSGWVHDMLEQIRSTRPSVINTLSTSVTDVKTYRVGVQQGQYGMRITS